MMTEDEAKKRWCPMVRVIVTPQCVEWQQRALTNRISFVESGSSESNCIASDCMAWRWEDDLIAEEYRPKKKSNKGYCSLAGKP